MPLVSGAAVVVPSEWERLNNLAGSIVSLNANFAFLTPTVIALLHPDQVPCLRSLASTGEALPDALVRLWNRRVNLYNAFGPAECAVICTVACGTDLDADPQNIGRAVGSVSWIVDPADATRLVPIGCVGELCIEGPILANGYLADEDKTAAVFLENPPWLCDATASLHRSGTRRVYCTGDLVKYNEDGSLSYLGRKDSQLKIHGQRVELAEVENCLSAALPHNTPAAASAVARKANDITIAAFVVTHSDDATAESSPLFRPMSPAFAAEAKAIAHRLATVLPAYMVPAVFIPITHMPTVRASQKKDRRLLRETAEQLSEDQWRPYTQLRERVNMSAEPLTATERELLGLWAEALDQRLPCDVGRHDDFLRLGGDSVAAMRLAAKALAHGYSKLDVTAILKNPELSQMARLVDDAGGRGSRVEAITDIKPFTLILQDDVTTLRIDAARRCGVPIEAIQDMYPCSPLQEAMFEATANQPKAYVSRNVFSCTARDGISYEQFLAAWNRTVTEYPILRTRFVRAMNGDLYQAVLAPEHNECRMDTGLLEDTVPEMSEGQPLVQISIVDTQQNGEAFIVLVLHHAIYDAFVYSLILESVNAAHCGLPLPRSTPFNGFIKQLNHTEKQDAAATFWRSRLAGATAPDFPKRRVSPARQSFSNLTHTVRLPQDRNPTILFSNLISASWALVLGQQTGTSDVVFGTVLSGRSAETAVSAGPTITTVPTRVVWRRKEAVSALLARVQDEAAETLAYQHHGLRRIQQVAGREACAFRTLLVVQQELSTHPPELVGHTALGSPLENFHTHPLNLEFVVSPSGDVQVMVQFDRASIEVEEVQSLLEQFEAVVRQLCDADEGEKTVGEIEVIGAADKRRIRELNSTVPPAATTTVAEMFEKKAQEYPNNPSIAAWDGTWTYAQLDRHSNALARHLADAGVGGGGHECCIPLLFERSGWYIVALVAVLKMPNVAFVPLDPSWPSSRLLETIEKVDAAHILMSPAQEAQIRALGHGDFPSTTVLAAGFMEASDVTPLDKHPQPTDLCYLILTSGSTGAPKGVMIEEASLATSLHARGPALGISPSTRTLHAASTAFDASLDEILLPLTHGGTVAVPHDDEVRTDLAASLRAWHANTAFLTPTAARTVPPGEPVGDLRCLMLLGEQVTADVARAWAPRAPRLLNGYGPSECAISATLGPIGPGDAGNIGTARGCCCWVVDPDDHARLVPPGCVGELCVEGPIVGRGYWGDEQGTRTRFLERAPWSGGELGGRGRAYKTGDLVRLNRDGTLTIVGRKDAQVKLRGQRLDLAGIEERVRLAFKPLDSAQVAVAAVLLPSSTEALAAFICSGQQRRPSDTENVCLLASPEFRGTMRGIRESLQATLPSYMVPSIYVPVSRIPSTVSGKTDRKSLRTLLLDAGEHQLASYMLQDTGPKQPPQTAAEATLRTLWAQVLGLQEGSIGVDDHWFLSGGDSVNAARLARAAMSCGMAITVSTVFRNPILRDLARVDEKDQINSVVQADDDAAPFSMISASSAPHARSEAAKQCGVQLEEIEDVLPCSSLQEGMFSTTLRKKGAYVNVFAYRIFPQVDLERFKVAWETVVASHMILRTRMIFLDGVMHQAVLRRDASWQQHKGDSITTLLAREEWKSTSIGSRLARFCLIETPEHGHTFVLMLHHALYDSHTLPMLLHHVCESYHGHEISPIVPFRHYIAHCSSLLDDSQTTQASEFWAQYLEGETAPRFPFLRARSPSNNKPPTSTHRRLQRRFALPRRHTTVKAITYPTILHGAWGLVLCTYNDADDICFGATLSGRDAVASSPSLEHVAGPTITTVPIRIQLRKGGGEPIAFYLERLQRDAGSVVGHQHVGLRAIRRASADAERACAFDSRMVVSMAAAADGDGTSLIEGLLKETEDSTGTETANMDYPLVLECDIRAGHVDVCLGFDERLASAPQMEAVVDSFQCAVEYLSRGCGTVDDVELTKPGQYHKSVATAESAAAPEETCIHTMIADRVREFPHKVAVESLDGSLTYGELWHASGRIARLLVAKGVKPEMLVPICCEKSK